MSSGWRKARIALGLHVCVKAPADPDDEAAAQVDHSPRTGNGSPTVSPSSGPSPRSGTPITSARSPSRLQLLRTSIRLSRSTCSICLEQMKPGLGHALFTAECSHTFHFSCIASNVRHGNLVCPVCRARWKEVPWQAPTEPAKEQKLPSPRPRRTRNGDVSAVDATIDEEMRRLDPVLRILDESIANARGIRRSITTEPQAFDDDEPLTPSSDLDLNHTGEGPSYQTQQQEASTSEEDVNLDVKCHAEVDTVCFSEPRDDFTVLVHIKALSASQHQSTGEAVRNTLAVPSTPGSNGRAPIDLVTVLDVSGSMAGTKLLLLKQAMGFVIRNLSPADRLSVIAFSSTAKRLFPLRRMVEEGRQLALRAIDALVSTGGTNIAEGLSKGAKALEDRRERNPIASIMLLSDGQDTHSLGARANAQLSRGGSLRRASGRHSALSQAVPFPVHTFGFGADHDSATMHAIAESSGGTFSFIQAEAAVQDAFAQCIGGLLSVVIQDAQLCFTTAAADVRVKNVQAGSYERSITEQGSSGYVKLGDLYAEEERDVLLQMSLPRLERPSHAAKVVNVECMYKDPVSQRLTRTRLKSLSISRPDKKTSVDQVVSVEVDRQRNRIRTAETILEAGCLADRGDLAGAQQTLQNAKLALRNSVASQAGDQLSNALESELTEIQVRMANRQMYERSGRAYILSAQSSHFRQRATARGDYVESQSRDYQTPSMVDMILRSQTLTFPLQAESSGERSSSLNRASSRRSSGRVHDIETTM